MIFSKHNIVLFIFISLIYWYESLEMFLEEGGGGTVLTLAVGILSLFCMTLIIIKKRNGLQSFSRIVLYLVGLMYLFSMLNIANCPFPARVLYLSNLLPFIILLVSNRIFLSKKEKDYDLTIMLTLVMFLVIFYYYNYQNNILNEVMSQNNSSYTILYFMPFVLCINNNKLKIIWLLIIALVLLTSLKRGGIIAFVVGVISYYLIDFLRNSNSHKNIFRFFVSIIPISIAMFYLFEYIDESMDNVLTYRFEKLETDEGSGRLDIWKWVLNDIQNNSIIEWFFGHGYNGVLNNSTLKMSAHNDFIEVIYDFGIGIFILYIILYKFLFSYSKRLLKRKSHLAAPLFSSTMVLLVNSLVSHVVIYPKYLVIFCLFWGYVDAKSKNV